MIHRFDGLCLWVRGTHENWRGKERRSLSSLHWLTLWMTVSHCKPHYSNPIKSCDVHCLLKENIYWLGKMPMLTIWKNNEPCKSCSNIFYTYDIWYINQDYKNITKMYTGKKWISEDFGTTVDQLTALKITEGHDSCDWSRK